MPPAHDVIVVGLGAMGSAAAAHLAGRGVRVLGLDRFAPPHALGSSAGRSRIIREAYFEDPRYVPLVQRAYALWDALAADSGREILVRTGGLMFGPPEGEVVSGALRSARAHGLPHELLSAAEMHQRVPALRPSVEMAGVWEPRAGVLLPEAAIAAHLALAARRGAELRTGEPVLHWRSDARGVTVATPRGTYHADRLVLAAGAWNPALLQALRLPLAVARQAVHWFRPARPTPLFDVGRFPVFIGEYAPGLVWYGFPDMGDGVKAALHHQGEAADPDRLRRTVAPEETAYVRALLHAFLPAAEGAVAHAEVCMYTNTPDSHFVVDRHPAHPRVVIASPCSGHGFKFSSALGEVLADLATDTPPAFDLAPFRATRFAGAPAARAERPRT